MKQPYIIRLAHTIKVECLVNNSAKRAAERKSTDEILSELSEHPAPSQDTENPFILCLM